MVTGDCYIICPECKEENKDYCYCSKCSECNSKNLEYYDDGEEYPPNILCKDCGNWNS